MGPRLRPEGVSRKSPWEREVDWIQEGSRSWGLQGKETERLCGGRGCPGWLPGSWRRWKGCKGGKPRLQCTGETVGGGELGSWLAGVSCEILVGHSGRRQVLEFRRRIWTWDIPVGVISTRGSAAREANML